MAVAAFVRGGIELLFPVHSSNSILPNLYHISCYSTSFVLNFLSGFCLLFEIHSTTCGGEIDLVKSSFFGDILNDRLWVGFFLVSWRDASI